MGPRSVLLSGPTRPGIVLGKCLLGEHFIFHVFVWHFACLCYFVVMDENDGAIFEVGLSRCTFLFIYFLAK